MKSVTKLLSRTVCVLALAPLSLYAAAIPGLFNTGVDANRVALAAGASDPHYLITVAAQGPINTGAIVMVNNAAWLANSTASTWIGVVNSGAANVAVGNFYFRTTFDLTGLEPSTAQISFKVSVDNDMVDVVLNGNSTGLSFSGFGGFSPTMTLTSGFVEGLNTLEFRTVNGGTAVNPGGFRAEFVSGTADVMNGGCHSSAGHTALDHDPPRQSDQWHWRKRDVRRECHRQPAAVLSMALRGESHPQRHQHDLHPQRPWCREWRNLRRGCNQCLRFSYQQPRGFERHLLEPIPTQL
jgi:hypothetical protein